MKRVSLNLLINVVFALAGIIFLIFSSRADILHWVSRVMGVLFMLPALCYLGAVMWKRKTLTGGLPWLGVTPAVGGVCFGLIMMWKSTLFIEIIAFLIGVLLLALGLFHTFFLFLSRRDMRLKLWHFVAPLLLIVLSLCILLSGTVRDNVRYVALMAGVGLLLFTFMSMVEHFALRKARVEDMVATSDSETSFPEPSEQPENESI